MWTTPQRGVVRAISVGILLYLTVRLLVEHAYVATLEPAEAPRARELADRLDPNTATGAELAAIPNVGDNLAAAMIDYRKRFISQNPGQTAFTKPDDLARVRGIGAAKVEMLRGYLIFPTKAPGAPATP